MANEKLSFDLLVNDRASAGFAAAGRAASDASDDVLGLAKRLDEVGRKSAKAKVGLEGDKDADLQLDKLSLKLLKLGKTVTRPDISVDGFLKASIEVKALELEMDKLSRKSVSINVSGEGINGLQRGLGTLFGTGGASGTSGGTSGGGALSAIPLIGGTSPAALGTIAAAATALLPELAGLVSGFAAAGAGVGAFGLLALPTFKAIATAYTGISAAQQKYTDALAKEKQDPTKANAAGVTTALNALKVAQDNLSPSTKTAVGGIDSLMTEYHKLTTAFRPDAMKVFDDALGIANTLLPDIKPFADTASGAIDGLLKHVGMFFKSADFKTWLASFDKIAGPAITAIGKGIGQVAISAGKLLTVMSSKDVVHAINIAFDTINGVLIVTAATVRGLMTAWDVTSADVKLHASQLAHFFVVDVPASFRLFRDETLAIWDEVEIDVLHMTGSIDGIMGKLPGPLGAPFRLAHRAIDGELAGIEASAARTAARINSDWASIHPSANITVHADGSFKVGNGLVGKAAGGLIAGGIPGRDSVLFAGMPGEVVVPTSMVNAGAVDHLRGRLPGFGAGGVVGNYSGSVPGLGPWMGREASAAQQALDAATAKSFTAAAQQALDAATAKSFTAAGKAAQSAAAFFGTISGGGGSGPVKALVQQLAADRGWTGTLWDALNAVEMREAGWNLGAQNPTSRAYGIAQFINGPSEYYQFGGNPNTALGQGTAFLNYVAQRYGNPLGALAHEEAFNWYGDGFHGWFDKPTVIGVGERGRERVDIGSGGGGGGNTYHITVNVPPGANQAEAGRLMVGAIRQYERGSGSGWRK